MSWCVYGENNKVIANYGEQEQQEQEQEQEQEGEGECG